MSDRIPTENEREPQVRAADASRFPTELAAAYALGYGDGERLVKAEGQDASDESLAPICARYLAHAEAMPASPADQAYLAGVRDAAADNLPSPPAEPNRHAA
jgi:hypothetical protein